MSTATTANSLHWQDTTISAGTTHTMSLNRDTFLANRCQEAKRSMHRIRCKSSFYAKFSQFLFFFFLYLHIFLLLSYDDDTVKRTFSK